MTDMVFCYGSDREKFPAHRVPHSQTFLAVVQRLRENGTLRPRSVDRCQEHTYTTDVRPRTSNSRDCGRKPVNKYPAVAREFQVSQFVVCRTLKQQGLHPYHVQRVQALQPNDYIRRQEFCE
jgi:hypothetical protein